MVGRRLRRDAARRAPAPAAAASTCRGSRTCRCSRSAPRGASARCGGWRRRRSDVALPLSIVLGARRHRRCSRSPSRASATTGAPSGRAGLAVAAAGGLTAAGVTAAQDFVLDNFDTGFGDAVVSSIWDAYLADLRIWALGARGRRPGGRRRGRRPAPLAGHAVRTRPPRAAAARCARPACSPSRRSPSSSPSSCCTPGSWRSPPGSSTSPPATCCASWRRRAAPPAGCARPRWRPACWA